MSNLDDKLKTIFNQEVIDPIIECEGVDPKSYFGIDSEDIIGQIKEAFKDAGYIYAPPTYNQVQALLDSGALDHRDEQIFRLYKLIDDIDTDLDIYKTDYNGFTKGTTSHIKERHNIVSDEQADQLYKKFYDVRANTNLDES